MRALRTSFITAVVCAVALFASLRAQPGAAQAAPPAPQQPSAGSSAAAPADGGALTAAQQNAILKQYCVVCHDDAQKTGGLSLEHFDAAQPDAALVGAIVEKLKFGEMPPAGRPRPDAGTLYALGASLSSSAGATPAVAHAAAPASAKPETVTFAHEADRMAPAAQTAMLQTVCAQCHTDDRKPGGVTFERRTIDEIAGDADLAERMIAKLRAGMMPPLTAPKRPDEASVRAFTVTLERRIDRTASLHRKAAPRLSQRLNRVEYARSVRALLGLDVDVTQWLPPDTMSHNFDNIAAVQDFSPTLFQSYLDAASEISRLAVGDFDATPTSVSYDVPQFTSQVDPVPDAPMGTRGGVSVVHVFPADGSYRFKLRMFGTLGGRLFGLTTTGEQILISIDDRPAALLDVDNRMSEAVPHGLTMESPAIDIKAGARRVSASFVQRSEGPVDDLIAPQAYTLADLDIGDAKGITLLPHLRTMSIEGPFQVTGVSDNATRQRIFICRPTSPDDELPCARKIVANLAGAAYRGRVSDADLQDLMKFYAQGRADGNFETGVRLALQAILVSPKFLFRIEPQPAAAPALASQKANDRALASRLSYFLWAEPPDDALLRLADEGHLHELPVLDAQVERMLKDPRSYALSTRFAAQWLRLQDVAKVRPDALRYPTYDGRLERAMVTETERFFDSIVRNDASVLDLLTADYTYVNDQLAAFYGIPDVAGSAFRRVSLQGTHRRGILGQGSILVETSVATRSNPVLRGKWVLEVLLGQPPPPPPPNVPALDATGAVNADGRPLSVRQRMEEHRRNPFCASCHRVIDPIGLSLEHFEPTGHWRIADNDVPVDAATVLYDGTKIDGLDGLVDALMKRQETFLRVFTTNLMAYALGRDMQFFDMPAVRSIVRSAGGRENRFSSFVLGIVNSEAFRSSVAPQPDAATDAGERAPARRF